MEKITYYKYDNPNVGVRYFKVEEGKPVLQIIESIQKKKGRPFQMGVNYITYMSFIGSWGWKLAESKNIKTIPKDKFERILDKMVLKFKK